MIMMFSRVLLLLVGLLGYLTNIQGITTNDVVNLYQPSLSRLRTFYTDRYAVSNNQYNTLVAQLNKDLAGAKTEANVLIAALKNTTATAKTKTTPVPAALTCVRAQETKVNGLSNAGLTNCNPAANLTQLRTLKEGFNTLNSVSANTVNYCKYLNPLAIQTDTLRICLVSKVADLLERVAVLESNYNELSNATLSQNGNCIANFMGSLLSRIGSINYEINLCLFRM